MTKLWEDAIYKIWDISTKTGEFPEYREACIAIIEAVIKANPEGGPRMTIKDLVWTHKVIGGDTHFTAESDVGRFTVLDRLTGFWYGIRDIETGFRNKSGHFWLASGGFDIRGYPDMTIEEAADLVIQQANTCIDIPPIPKEARE
jgi:hypothetical protein